MLLPYSGANGNRTSDTRIFSPLLYQLSYGTNAQRFSNCGCKGSTYFLISQVCDFIFWRYLLQGGCGCWRSFL